MEEDDQACRGSPWLPVTAPLCAEQTANLSSKETVLGCRKYSNAPTVVRYRELASETAPSLSFRPSQFSLQGNSWPAPAAPVRALEAEAKHASRAAHADSARLYSGFYLPAHGGITSSKHWANSRDLGAPGQVPRVQVPTIPQHGKGASCLPGQAPG